MRILICNAGSTSLKFKLWDMPEQRVLAEGKVERVVGDALGGVGCDVYVAGCQAERQEGRVHFAPRFVFSELLPRARCFVHHGGQNSTMDALAHAVP